MWIWLAAVIPLVTIGMLHFKYRHRLVPWEYLLITCAPLALIVLMKLTTDTVQTRDTEFIGGKMVTAVYTEFWQERVHCRHEVECLEPCIDADGDLDLCWETCGYEHQYDIDDHPAFWTVIDEMKNEYEISQNEYVEFARLWKNEQFQAVARTDVITPGGQYVTGWNGEDRTLVPVTIDHSYENKPQAASDFEFEEVDADTLGLFEYPEIGRWDQQAVLGDAGPDTAAADRILRLWNAKLGPTKQVHMFLLVFRGVGSDIGAAQNNYWKRGNKNEFNVMVGLDRSNRVQWAQVMTWSEEVGLIDDVTQFVQSQESFDVIGTVRYMAEQVGARFVRKQFADFSYLTVEPATWAIVLTYLLTLSLCVGLGMYSVHNRHYDYDDPRNADKIEEDSWRS